MSTEEKETEQQEEPSTEETTESESQPTPEPTVTEPTLNNDTQELLKQILEQQRLQTELTRSLKDENEKLKSELKQVKEDVEKDKPVRITAIVKGKVDYNALAQKHGAKTEEAFIDHCRSVYDRINNSVSTINKLV